MKPGLPRPRPPKCVLRSTAQCSALRNQLLRFEGTALCHLSVEASLPRSMMQLIVLGITEELVTGACEPEAKHTNVC